MSRQRAIAGVVAGLVLAATATLSAGPARASGLPDLSVVSISMDPATPVTGQWVTFSAVVTNTGTAATPAGTVVGVNFKIDGHSVSWSDNNTTSLAPGASETLTANSGPSGSQYWIATTGAHTLLATVDDINRIPESDETNNALSEPLTVATPLPDLTVSNLTYAPARVHAGDHELFGATVRNAGLGETPPGAKITIGFYIDGAEVSYASHVYTDRSDQSMHLGDSFTWTANNGKTGHDTWIATPGTHTLTAKVDYVNSIAESDETNNKVSESITTDSVCGAGKTPTSDASGTTCTYSSTGAEQAFVVPAGVTSLDVTAVGASGTGYEVAGGAGATVSGTVAVTPGETLYAEVGGPAFYNGGGNGDGGNATDLRRTSVGTTLQTWAAGLPSRVIVAGGGGGGGGCGSNGVDGCGNPGGAGGAAGQDGQDASPGPGAGGLAGEHRPDVTGNGAGDDWVPAGNDEELSGAGGGGYTGGAAGTLGESAPCQGPDPDPWEFCLTGAGGGGGGSSFVDGHEVAGTPVAVGTPASLSITFRQPNLVVTGLSQTPLAPAAGDHVVFSATVQNAGSAAIPAGTVVTVGFYVDGAEVSYSDKLATGLAPGQSATVTANWSKTGVKYWVATSGSHLVTAKADYTNTIPESNERDNTVTGSIVVP